MKDEILKLQKDAMRKDASAQETIEKLRVQLEDRKKQVTSLESKIAEEGKNASQKQQVIDSLSSALTSAEKKAAQLETAAKQLSETETALKELRAQYEELKEEQKRIRKQLEEKETLCSQMKETHTQELERHKNDYIRQLETCKNESKTASAVERTEGAGTENPPTNLRIVHSRSTDRSAGSNKSYQGGVSEQVI